MTRKQIKPFSGGWQNLVDESQPFKSFCPHQSRIYPTLEHILPYHPAPRSFESTSISPTLHLTTPDWYNPSHHMTIFSQFSPNIFYPDPCLDVFIPNAILQGRQTPLHSGLRISATYVLCSWLLDYPKLQPITHCWSHDSPLLSSRQLDRHLFIPKNCTGLPPFFQSFLILWVTSASSASLLWTTDSKYVNSSTFFKTGWPPRWTSATCQFSPHWKVIHSGFARLILSSLTTRTRRKLFEMGFPVCIGVT